MGGGAEGGGGGRRGGRGGGGRRRKGAGGGDEDGRGPLWGVFAGRARGEGGWGREERGGKSWEALGVVGRMLDVGCWMLNARCQGAAPLPQTSLAVVEAVKKQEQGMVVVGEVKMAQLRSEGPMKPENISSLDSLAGRVWLVAWAVVWAEEGG